MNTAMNLLRDYALEFLNSSGVFAPLIFIIIHMLRPLLFIPVILLCVSGGLLFGLVPGIIYSLIGITLSSLIFYFLVRLSPRTVARLLKLKDRLFGGQHQFSTKQIAFLRLVPFIHFHLLSLCLYESTSDFKTYTKASALSNIPIAILYTGIGQTIIHLSLIQSGIILLILASIYYVYKRKLKTVNRQDIFKQKEEERLQAIEK